MDEDEKSVQSKKKNQKHRAMRGAVEAVMAKRSRHHHHISDKIEMKQHNEAESVNNIPMRCNHETIEKQPERQREAQTVISLNNEESATEENREEPIQRAASTGSIMAEANECERVRNPSFEDDGRLAEESEGGDAAGEGELDEVTQIRRWAIVNNIRQKALNDLLAILRNRVLPQLPKSAKTFLKTAAQEFNIREMQAANDSIGEYVYFGISKGLEQSIREDLHENNTIMVQINCDGLPLFKSSAKQFWPILCKIFFDPDIYEPFPIAIFAGDAKPKYIDEYLHDFIEEINILHAKGFTIKEYRFDVKIHSIVCDTPARSFLKGIKGHGGYWACERCETKGERVDRRTVYPEIDSQERTDSSFRIQAQPEHHKYRSPLLDIEPPIDMVRIFSLDYMHLCCEGIMKKLIEFWIFGKAQTGLQRRNKLAPRQKIQLSRLMMQLRKCIPSEFQRKPRSLSYVAQWKATEYRFFLLYCGPVVLRGILNPELYMHFLLLHTACRILSSNEYAFMLNAHAKLYLTRFFEAMALLYGQQSQILNAHNLIHMTDDTVNLNCTLGKISAFPFESTLGKIKALLRNANRPLAQICRRLHEMTYVSKKPSIPLSVEVLKLGISENEDRIHVKKLRYKGFVLTTAFPNNLVMLKNDVIITLTKITRSPLNETDILVEGNPWRKKKSIFQYPTNSTDLKMWQLNTLPSRQIMQLSVNDIERKMLQIVIKPNPLRPQTKVFAIPLLHS